MSMGKKFEVRSVQNGWSVAEVRQGCYSAEPNVFTNLWDLHKFLEANCPTVDEQKKRLEEDMKGMYEKLHEQKLSAMKAEIAQMEQAPYQKVGQA